jgi:membrane protein
MFRLLYRLLSTTWFRRVLLLVFGTGSKVLQLKLPEAREEWERIVAGEEPPPWTGAGLAVRVVRYSMREASDDDVTGLASSMAFYVMLGLGPLLAVVLGIAGLISPLARQGLIQQVQQTFGAAPAHLIEGVVGRAALQSEESLLAVTLGALVLFFNIASVFASLQAALNRIWDVKARPGRSVWRWIRKRLVSAGLLVVMAILVAVAALSEPVFPRLIHHALLAGLLNYALMFTLFTLIFGLILQYLPDAAVPWRQVWVGAAATAALFLLGRYLISLYLIHGGVATAYGATASFVVLMLGVFYNALILFLGAEITHVYARLTRHPLTPEEHAEPAPEALPTVSRPAAVHTSATGP